MSLVFPKTALTSSPWAHYSGSVFFCNNLFFFVLLLVRYPPSYAMQTHRVLLPPAVSLSHWAIFTVDRPYSMADVFHHARCVDHGGI